MDKKKNKVTKQRIVLKASFYKTLFSIFLISVFSAFITFIWFKEKNIMGVAEDGLTFYKIGRYLSESEYAWTEHPGLGRPSFNNVAGKPTFLLLTYLESTGFRNYQLQALVIFFLLLFSGIGIYLLVKEEFPFLSNIYIFSATFFYWFNPITLANVWNRFLLNYLFFFSILPISIYFYVKGLKDKKIINLFLFIIICGVLSYTFTFYVYTAVLWLIIILITFAYIIIGNVKITWGLKYLLLSIALFVVTNLWWITQFVSYIIRENLTASEIYNFNSDINIGTLKYLSEQLGNLKDLLNFRNASFFQRGRLPWIDTYNNPLISYFGYLIFGSILYVFIFFKKEIPFKIFLSKNKLSNLVSWARNNTKEYTLPFIDNHKSLIIWLILLTLSLILSIGSNPPFGIFYQFVFNKISFFQVFRNSFEKFGFFYSLSLSMLFPLTLYLFVNKFKKIRYLILVAVLLIFITWIYPFLSRKVFTNTFYPANDERIGYQVKVPTYYEDANNWLNQDTDNFRLVGYPIGEEGITYKWEKGYSGLELSTALYDKTVILHKTPVQYYSEIVGALPKLLEEDNFINILNILNVKYVLIRKDIDYLSRSMISPDEISNTLSKNIFLEKSSSFGQLDIWKNNKWQDFLIYTASSVIKTDEIYPVENLKNINPVKSQVVLRDLNQVGFIDNDLYSPSLKYKKINPAFYLLSINKSKQPYYLVLSEIYDKRWTAINKDTEKIYDMHYIANVYANAWYIDDNPENIHLIFTPQDTLQFGEKVSTYAYCLILIILVILFTNSILRKYDY